VTDEQVSDYAKARGFHPQTLARLSEWDAPARAALGRLAVMLKVSENHLRDLMDWLEEIAVRDRRAIELILQEKAIADVETDPRLGRADKLKRVKDEIRRLRFPRLSRTEDALRACISVLKLQPEIIVSTPPGLESGKLRFEFSVSSQQELRRVAAKLVDAAEKAATKEAFDLLSGVPSDTKLRG